MSTTENHALDATDATAAPSAGHYHFKVGKLSCTAISDGCLVGAPQMLAAEVPLEEVLGYLEERGLHKDRVAVVQLSCLLVRDEESGRTILIDTGIGQAPGPSGSPMVTAGKLAGNLAAAGVAPEDVDTVLISHLHPDHVGGAFDADEQSAFPNATFHVGEEEVAFWSADEPDRSGILAPPEFKQASTAVAKRFLRLVEPRAELFSLGGSPLPGIKSVAVPGHTVGQSGFLIESEGDALLYTADAMGHPVISVEKPHWRFFGDGESAVAIETRKRLIEELREQRRRFFTPHFPWPNIGRIGTVGAQSVWMPEPFDWS